MTDREEKEQYLRSIVKKHAVEGDYDPGIVGSILRSLAEEIDKTDLENHLEVDGIDYSTDEW